MMKSPIANLYQAQANKTKIRELKNTEDALTSIFKVLTDVLDFILI